MKSNILLFDPFKINLPVTEIIPEAREHLAKTNTLILNAPPGAGKSTLLPLAFLEESWLKNKKILMLEPRRLATKTIAERMAELLGENTGDQVGYRIRFEQKIGPKTRIEVLTEGILTRMLHQDNALEEVGMVIFDEFHERNLHGEVAMALCREAQQILRPDLRILVMSATLDMPQLAELLQSPVIVSKGKQYPVELIYTGSNDEWLMPEMTAKTILQAAKEKTGDILAFLPGQGEIKKCEAILRKELPDFSIHPLYGQLSNRQQTQAILPRKDGKRKVVLATSIAETSLTIEGISVVVDSGFGRNPRFDPKSGLSKLVTQRISQDSADQRAGRAGRLGPGTCYRMWTKATQASMQPFRNPEILEADLTALVLDMLQWGIQDIQKMSWLTPPPSGNLAQAMDTLEQLQAVENGKITLHGKEVHALPCHPRIAHMLIKASASDQLALATDVAALMEERDPMGSEAGVDMNLRIEQLRRVRKENLQVKAFQKIEKVAASYRKMFGIAADNRPFDPFETGVLLAYAYPERIASARPGNNAQFQLANGKLAMMGHRDDLAHESWIAIAHVDARDGVGKIFLAAPLNPKDLLPLVKEKEILTWDTRKGGLQASKDLRIGSIVLQSKPITHIPEKELDQILSTTLKAEGAHLLDFNEAVTQFQYRVNALKIWRPEENWPDFQTNALLENTLEWLAPYWQGVRKNEALKKLPLEEILFHSLSPEQQKALHRLAPEKIEVPSGSKVRLQYAPDGQTPVLAVRLQELFGMQETPRVNGGQVPVLIHLLSPGFKPVQVTGDLKSFWQNTYFEVRKELKRRYPKHYWPDDPLQAEAVSGVKRKK
ncbi:ATP-dependent helicase HrpB [Pararhodonellum marinum]|uniref:ATP-dependent helicase HrpB n=1 Tax=Pararhodonellum marinum TaxID=2755358 RepID=UPI00188ED447|nr:ATP-dependent helicase HrpB [Pararhodonellum marinum]